MIPWLKAARIPSQLYLALSLLMGHAIFYQVSGSINWPLVVGFAVLGIFLQLYIVFGNDVADFETDKLNKTSTLFSGGSRVLVEQSLSLQQLKKAHYLMTTLSLVTGLALAYICQSWELILLTMIAILLLWMYSYPPVKLSYRGGGEFLQVIGLGIILPLIAFIGQGGKGIPLGIILSLIPSHLACAIGTSLADEPSDRLSNKRTFTVILGQGYACLLIAMLQASSLIILLALNIGVPLLNHMGVLSYFLVLLLGFLFNINAKPGNLGMSLKIFLTILYTQSLIGVNIWNCFV